MRWIAIYSLNRVIRWTVDPCVKRFLHFSLWTKSHDVNIPMKAIIQIISVLLWFWPFDGMKSRIFFVLIGFWENFHTFALIERIYGLSDEAIKYQTVILQFYLINANEHEEFDEKPILKRSSFTRKLQWSAVKISN